MYGEWYSALFDHDYRLPRNAQEQQVLRALKTFPVPDPVSAAIPVVEVPVKNGKVNINVATEAELLWIKGIGRTLAKAIITYRDQNGPFQSIDDLAHVKGIGPSTLEDIKPQVTLAAVP